MDNTTDLNKTYLVIDLKSFFASVEIVLRGFDALKTKLVVADPSRGDGAICLAVSSALKECGVKNRCRIFEIPKGIDYIIAKPRMQRYIDFASEIYAVYLKYVSKEDILVYSIDECFIDITSYLQLYKTDDVTLAKRIMDDVYNTTKIRATCGIGYNMFVAKLALDLYAKHSKDFIGKIDKKKFEEQTIYHKPITDIWQIARGIKTRLEKYNVYCLNDIRNVDERLLYKEFGVNAEFIIDHAYGIEPCTIEDVHNYTSKSKSITNGQILFEDYKTTEARSVLKEMIDVSILELLDNNLVTNNISLYVGYSKDAIKPLAKSRKLPLYTNSLSKLTEFFLELYDKSINHNHMIRRISISFNNIKYSETSEYDLFDDLEKLDKEKKVHDAIIDIKKKYGKNSIVKAYNLDDKATTISRNKLIGGHNAN